MITTPRLAIARAFATSMERLRRLIAADYELLLRRSPAAGEVDPLVPGLQGPNTLFEMESQFAASPEYWQDCSEQPATWIGSLYHDFLGRQPDTPGLANWVSKLTTLSMAQTPRVIDGTGPGGEDWVQEEARNEADIRAGLTYPLVFLGDSITDFLMTTGKAVWDQYYKPIPALNLAISGLSTREVLWQITQLQVGAVSPKVVVLMIGTNNALTVGSTPQQTAEGIVSCVQALQDVVPGVKVVCQSLLPRGSVPSDPMRSYVAAVNAIVPTLLVGAVWLDVTRNWVQADGTIPKVLLSDGIHPSPTGYQLWNAQAYAVIKQTMGG